MTDKMSDERLKSVKDGKWSCKGCSRLSPDGCECPVHKVEIDRLKAELKKKDEQITALSRELTSWWNDQSPYGCSGDSPEEYIKDILDELNDAPDTQDKPDGTGPQCFKELREQMKPKTQDKPSKEAITINIAGGKNLPEVFCVLCGKKNCKGHPIKEA